MNYQMTSKDVCVKPDFTIHKHWLVMENVLAVILSVVLVIKLKFVRLVKTLTLSLIMLKDALVILNITLLLN